MEQYKDCNRNGYQRYPVSSNRMNYGNRNSCNSNAGNSGSCNKNTCNSGSCNVNSGNRNSCNSGSCNANSGNRNSCNSGYGMEPRNMNRGRNDCEATRKMMETCGTQSPHPVGMAYVPSQEFGELYDAKKGLREGTMFPALNLIFCGVRGK